MSAAASDQAQPDLGEEDEIFVDCGASPELRRSSRNSGRKRSSTGYLPYSKVKAPRKEKRMSVTRTPTSATRAQPETTPSAVGPTLPVFSLEAVIQ